MKTTFTTFLLADNFDITDNEAAKVLGNMGTIGDVASVSTEFFVGYIMDSFGRRIPCIVGLILSGIGYASNPLPNRLIGLYCLRAFNNVAALPLLLGPQQIDYI